MGNTAEGTGGAILDGGSSPVIERCYFLGNVSEEWGGAIFSDQFDGPSSPTIRGCRFFLNQAQFGGGFYYGGHATAAVENSIFVDNLAQDGGAIGTTSNWTLNVSSCTIVRNSATGVGGGIQTWSGTATNLSNCIIWNNTDGSGSGESAQVSYTVAPPNIHYSNVQGWSGALGGEGNSGFDPMFVNAEAGDFQLSPWSPVINAGDPSLTLPGAGVDLASHPRVLCGRVDMGAYEFGIGDFDCDRDVDLFDFAGWPGCVTGPKAANLPAPDAQGVPLPYGRGSVIHALDPGCEAFDFDGDSDIDLADFGGMQAALGAP